MQITFDGYYILVLYYHIRCLFHNYWIHIPIYMAIVHIYSVVTCENPTAGYLSLS